MLRSTKDGDIDKWRKVLFSHEKKIASMYRWFLTLLVRYGYPSRDIFYTTQWRKFHRDLGCYLLSRNNAASNYTAASNCGWLRWHVGESIDCILLTDG